MLRFRLGPIPVEVHPSHLLIAAVLGFSGLSGHDPLRWPGRALASGEPLVHLTAVVSVVSIWVAIVFLSGHGENDQEGRFYFCPHDYDHTRRLRTGVSFEDIQKIRELQARVGVLEEHVRQLLIAQRKQTLSLPIKEPRKN